MDYERLRVVLEIVDTGSMTAAARALHLTQPAPSRSQLDLAVLAYSGAPKGIRTRRIGPYRLQCYGRKDRFATLAGCARAAEIGAFSPCAALRR